MMEVLFEKLDTANLEIDCIYRGGNLHGKASEVLHRLIDCALEAKCYDVSHGVGVRQISRLISRIRYRQFGIMVTSSYVDSQAYQEVIENGHPIVAEKFGVSDRSIWRDINLIKLPSDGTMLPTKGGISSGTHHSTGSADEAS